MRVRSVLTLDRTDDGRCDFSRQRLVRSLLRGQCDRNFAVGAKGAMSARGAKRRCPAPHLGWPRDRRCLGHRGRDRAANRAPAVCLASRFTADRQRTGNLHRRAGFGRRHCVPGRPTRSSESSPHLPPNCFRRARRLGVARCRAWFVVNPMGELATCVHVHRDARGGMGGDRDDADTARDHAFDGQLGRRDASLTHQGDLKKGVRFIAKADKLQATRQSL